MTSESTVNNVEPLKAWGACLGTILKFNKRVPNINDLYNLVRAMHAQACLRADGDPENEELEELVNDMENMMCQHHVGFTSFFEND